MKQKLNYAVSITVLYLLMIFTGCKKEITGSAINQSSLSDEVNEKITCRLIGNKDVYGNLNSFQYNDRGLVEKWAYSTPEGYKEELTVHYDNKKRISVAWYEFSGNLFRIEYLYKDDRIIKEFWFVGNTEIVDDTVLITYNDKGKIIKLESLLYQYYSTFEYDAAGNAYQVNVTGYDGYLYIAGTYSFTKKIKDPYRALPGIPFGLQYTNLVFNTYQPTGIRLIVTGEDGSLVTLFDYDPVKSILKAGPVNFPVYQNFFDNLTGTWYDQAWRYQNCDCGDEASNILAFTDPAKTSILPNKMNRKYISSAGIRELVKERGMKRK